MKTTKKGDVSQSVSLSVRTYGACLTAHQTPLLDIHPTQEYPFHRTREWGGNRNSASISSNRHNTIPAPSRWQPYVSIIFSPISQWKVR